MGSYRGRHERRILKAVIKNCFAKLATKLNLQPSGSAQPQTRPIINDDPGRNAPNDIGPDVPIICNDPFESNNVSRHSFDICDTTSDGTGTVVSGYSSAYLYDQDLSHEEIVPTCMNNIENGVESDVGDEVLDSSNIDDGEKLGSWLKE